MYSAQITKERIDAQRKGATYEQIQSACNIGANAIRQISNEKGLASFSLAKIADFLDCSVDYLLGRTDNPSAHKSTVSVGDVSDNHGVIGNANAPLTINHTENNPQRSALLDTYDKLTPVQQAKLLLFADNLLNGE